jgi:hypothetical protein
MCCHAFFSSSKLLKRLHDLRDTAEKEEGESQEKRGEREVEVERGGREDRMRGEGE